MFECACQGLLKALERCYGYISKIYYLFICRMFMKLYFYKHL